MSWTWSELPSEVAHNGIDSTKLFLIHPESVESVLCGLNGSRRLMHTRSALVDTFHGWLANRDLNIKSVRSTTRNCITMLNAFRDIFDLFDIFIRVKRAQLVAGAESTQTSLHSCRKNKSNPQWLRKHKNSFHHSQRRSVLRNTFHHRVWWFEDGKTRTNSICSSPRSARSFLWN